MGISTTQAFENLNTIARTDAFIAANTQECRKCRARNVPISKRTQLCGPCTEVKRGTQIDLNAAMPNRSVPIGETPEQCNRRLHKAHSERAAAEAKRRPTIAMLITGAPGHAKATGVVLNWCDQSISLRATLAEDLKRLGQLENFVTCHPRNQNGWNNLESKQTRIEMLALRLREVEAKIQEARPEVLIEPLNLPAMLEREPSWMDT